MAKKRRTDKRTIERNYTKGYRQAAELIATVAECRGYDRFAADIRKYVRIIFAPLSQAEAKRSQSRKAKRG